MHDVGERAVEILIEKANRPRFSLRSLFLLIALVGFLMAPVAAYQYRRQRSAAALEEIRALCVAKGGGYGRLLVDGEVEVRLAGTHLTAAEANRLRQLFDRIVPEYLDYSGAVHLDLSGATVEGGLLPLLHPCIEELRLADTKVDDALVAEIVKRCPKLKYVDLDRTQVTDAAVQAMEPLRLYHLRVDGTKVSPRGLQRISERSLD